MPLPPDVLDPPLEEAPPLQLEPDALSVPPASTAMTASLGLIADPISDPMSASDLGSLSELPPPAQSLGEPAGLPASAANSLRSSDAQLGSLNDVVGVMMEAATAEEPGVS